MKDPRNLMNKIPDQFAIQLNIIKMFGEHGIEVIYSRHHAVFYGHVNNIAMFVHVELRFS